jgi:hypothetical protein
VFQGAEAGLSRENGDQSSKVTMRADSREKILRFEESKKFVKISVVDSDGIIFDN